MCNIAGINQTQPSVTCLALNLAEVPQTLKEDEIEVEPQVDVLRTLR
jgi:hypothetical protein